MEFFKNTNVNWHRIRRIAIGLFCLWIGICVAFVLLKIYTPDKNSLGALGSVCMDAVCIIMLFILLGDYALDQYGLKRTTQLFVGMLLATVWALFLDFLNWAFDGSLEVGNLTYWFTLGSLCMGAVMAGLFSLYLYSYMEETHGLGNMRRSAIICAIANLISFALTFVLAITGTAFQFVDGHYETGALYDVVTVIPVLSLLYLTGFTVRYIKKIGFHDVFAVAGYIVFMIIGALIETEYRIGTTYVAVALADIFIYVMLQNVIIAEEKKNVLKWMNKSKIDALTGLFNRYAYESEMNALEEADVSDSLVYISADVNSLKVINDSFGHVAGDELIIGAAKCLSECFGSYGKLYRIGGDEFVAIIYADAERLPLIWQNFEEVTGKWHGKLVDRMSISCGYATRLEDKDIPLRQIANLADRRMYESKKEYYKSTGNERRSQQA